MEYLGLAERGGSMSIGILYGSQEWSSTALCDYIREMGIDASLIDLEQDVNLGDLLSHKLIVNRIFASAQFRGHKQSLDVVKDVLDRIVAQKIPLINSYQAHFYEISKLLTAQTLETNHLPSPEIYACFNSLDVPDYSKLRYPCILKPNCGGRTTYTYLIETEEQLKTTLPIVEAPESHKLHR